MLLKLLHTGDHQFNTAVDAIRQHIPNTQWLFGVPSVDSDDMSGIPAAVKLASDVDQVDARSSCIRLFIISICEKVPARCKKLR